MLSLSEFLLARIAEDEADVEATRTNMLHAEGEVAAEDALERLANPKRLAAECEAKRRIVELSWHHLGEDDYGWGMEEAKRQVLAILALPYADHPDYDESWRP